MRILVIEDEAKTAKFLKKGLGEAGFLVNVADDGMDGLHLAKEFEFDLIILDVMLPGLDGWQEPSHPLVYGITSGLKQDQRAWALSLGVAQPG